MINHLYVNGDSWTYGNGVDEDPKVIHDGLKIPLQINERLSYTWASYLAKKLSVEVTNGSIGGGSNARIVRTTSDFLQKYPKEEYKNLLMIIGWTTVERNEIFINRQDYPDRYYAFNAAQKFSDQFNTDVSSEVSRFNGVVNMYQKGYVTNVQNNEMNITNYFIQLTLMKNLLENLGIKYMFFNAIPWHWLQMEQDVTKFEGRLVRHAGPKFIGSLTRETMSSFVEHNNYPMSSCKHTMSLGHEAWANRLYSELEKVYKDDITKTN
jgi:hypothetical protein